MRGIPGKDNTSNLTKTGTNFYPNIRNPNILASFLTEYILEICGILQLLALVARNALIVGLSPQSKLFQASSCCRKVGPWFALCTPSCPSRAPRLLPFKLPTSETHHGSHRLSQGFDFGTLGQLGCILCTYWIYPPQAKFKIQRNTKKGCLAGQ